MIKKLRVTVDGKPYEVTVEMPDEAEAAPSYAAPAPIYAPPPSAAPPPKPGAAPGEVPSPLSGRVIAVLVKPGQAVTAHEQLLTIEAMKMNTSVLAPSAGKVAEVFVAVGAAVDEGQRLVRIEEAR